MKNQTNSPVEAFNNETDYQFNKKLKITIIVFSILIVVFSMLYLISWYFKVKVPITNPNIYWRLIKPKILKLLAIFIAGVLLSIISLVFQTITDNRILTPAMIGIDATFITTQTFIVLLAGSTSVFITNSYLNFTISTVAMVSISLILFSIMLKKNKDNVMLLLLTGIVLAQILTSASNFVKILMSPDDFTIIYNLTGTTLNNINTNLLYIALPIMTILCFLFIKQRHVYDVLSLGEQQATSLGIDFNKAVTYNLVLISISMAIATALIGSLSFLGLITVNAAKELYKKINHKVLIVLSSLIGVLIIIIGQTIIEMLYSAVMLSSIISLVGCIYVIILIIKGSKI